MLEFKWPLRITPRRLLGFCHPCGLCRRLYDTLMARLPSSERAILDIRKIEDYCLDPGHPRGRHKARVFRELLGVTRSDGRWLRDALLKAVRNVEAIELAADAFGSRWRVDLSISRRGKTAMIRTIWIVRTGEDAPRFVTCWVLR